MLLKDERPFLNIDFDEFFIKEIFETSGINFFKLVKNLFRQFFIINSA